MVAPTVATCPNVPPDPVFRSIRVSVSLPFGSCQARLIWVAETAVADRPVGATGETEIPVPVTALVAPPAPLKVTLLEKVPVEVGLKRTVTRWLCPAEREEEPPKVTRNGAPAVAVPLTAPPPVFCTVKVRSSELPTGTLPKDRELGVTLIVGGGAVAVAVQRSAVLSLRLCVLKLTWVPLFGLT